MVKGTNAEPEPDKATTAIRRMHCLQSSYAAQAGTLDAAPAAAPEAFFRVLFQRADEQAQLYQKQLNHTFTWIFTAAVAAAILLGANSDLYCYFPKATDATFWSERFLLLAGYLTVISGALLLFWRAKRHRFQDQYQDIRALAEGFRVQMHWAAADINESVADHYLEKQRSSLDWIRGTLRQAFLQACANSPPPPPETNWRECSRRIRAAWIRDQETYFAGKTTAQQRLFHRNERAAKVLFMLGLLIAASLLGTRFLPYTGILPRPDSHGAEKIIETTLAVANFLPVLAGLIKYRVEKLGLAEHVLLYNQMAGIFRNARCRLEELDTLPADAPDNGRQQAERYILRDLGAAALAENADWLVLHRFKEIQLPG